MSRTLPVAVIQMIAQPAPLNERLERAAHLLAQAAGAGAQLVALPELFNTGYEYSPENYRRAESDDGPTARWITDRAARHGVHLAGSFLRRAGGEIYNTLLLVAPDGRRWCYDKTYPWVWERAYFRPGAGPRVADTDLGRIGLMICWDVAHAALWRAYAGQVQFILACSCPPAVHNMDFVFPDGKRVNAGEAGPIQRDMQRRSGEVFGSNILRQAAWLGVPLANTTGTGAFSTRFPSPRTSLFSYFLMRPDLWPRLRRAGEVRVECGYFNETFVATAGGEVLARVAAESENYTLAGVSLPDTPPRPAAPQPPYGAPASAYLFDRLANTLLVRDYSRAKQTF